VRVDKELVEQMVVQIMGQLANAQGVENVLILGSKNDAASISLPKQDDVTTKVYCSDDACDATEIDRYVLPSLEIEDMADLALGKATSVKARQILALLLGGKTVEVYQYAYAGYENSAPSQLYQLYCDYAETLSGFGICPLQKHVQKTTRVNARVVSENDIEKCNAQGVTRIGVSDRTIVTSLAEECAKKFGIEIQRG
jgi:ethanolamine utilization protein